MTGTDDGCLETAFREVLQVQGDDEIGLALLGAKAEWIILGVGPDFTCAAHPRLFGSHSDQVDDFPDEIRTNAEAL